MTDIVRQLLLRNLHEVFGEGDLIRRKAAVEELFTQDAEFHEPAGIWRGRDAINRIAGEIRATHPHFQYTPLREPDVLGAAAGRIQWVAGPVGAAPAYAGTDVIVVRDGRIAALCLFFDEVGANI
ncbi:nuclear transport factor 2 family protein [Novosphingobium sp. BL-8H]|uniref:nuclear transport factor 2 family protein n=1 Tax=Novosphingobium sp. BL-8H TaxID=3127640 RepID=UPI0037578416